MPQPAQPPTPGETIPVPYPLDPYSYVLHEDPYPAYRWLREHEPVHHSPELGFWAVSRHADVRAAFLDKERFSSANGVTLDPAAYGPHAHRTMSFLAMDDPKHLRMRSLVSRRFNPRFIAPMRGRITEITHEHLDPALRRGEFDFIGDVAARIPMDVISEMMGVPPPDRVEIRRLADAVVHREDGSTDLPQAAVEAAMTLLSYYVDLLARRRAHPQDDLTSELAQTEVDGDALTDAEIIGFLFLMVVAGNETTTKLLGNAAYWGHRHPGQLAMPFADAAHVPGWVEETLRYDTSSQMLLRTTAADVTMHGVTIPAGQKVLVLVGSANRDERVFDAPDAYRIERDSSAGLLSFGVGTHYCLGVHLARLEATVVLTALRDAASGFALDEAGCARVHSSNVRGFASMPMRVTLR
ncbi:cytochrome P450 [Tomitella gaofuii]|uniref:cytochrome P450 n=1 Tax=Tomitella gaofuii TaxID=2760083 RepID=UPI0015F88947|nr:cytochrome P450 [Tomitella gaofuii]